MAAFAIKEAMLNAENDQTEIMRKELLSKHGVVVTDVPYRVYKELEEKAL